MGTVIRVHRTIAFLVLLLLTASLIWAPSARADDPDPVKPGSQYLGSCIQSARTVSVLVVLDRSGSLITNDSAGVRYEGLRVLLEQLSRMSRADGDPLSVEVAISAFEDDYAGAGRVVDWTNVNEDPDNRAQIIDRMVENAERGSRPIRQSGTNFEAALTGALDDLEDRGGQQSCEVLIWFTDGEFTSSAKGVDASRADMCAPGGLLDAIRRLGIVVIGLQLGTDASDLQPMTLGSALGTTCGTYPFAEGSPPGIYLNATDVDQLGGIFNKLATILQGCTDAGDSGLIDPGIRRMIVSAETAGLPGTVRLQPPDGAAFDAPTVGGSSHPGGYTTHGTSEEGQLRVEVTFPPGGGAGQWSASHGQIATPRYCVFSDLALQPLPDQTVEARAGAVVELQVVDRSGAPAGITEYDSNAVAAVVTGPDGLPRIATASVTDDGRVAVTFDAEPTDPRIDYSVQLILQTQSGLDLAPVAVKSSQELMLWADYPVVTPRDHLDLGTAIKKNPTSADLTLIGSPNGPTQVCFGAPENTGVPADAGATTLDYPLGCIDLAPNESRTVAVSVTPESSAVGDGYAEIPTTLHPAATSGAPTVTFPLPAVWRFENPFNPWVLILTTAAIALISALLPWLALGLANKVTARYTVNGLRHAIIPVVSSDGVLRPANARGTQDLLTTLDLKGVPGLGSRPVSHFRVGEVEFQSKSRPTPTFSPQFWAEAPPGMALVGTTASALDPLDGSRVTVPPGLGLVGLLVCSTADLIGSAPQIPGNLIVLTNDPHMTGPKISGHMAQSLSPEHLREHLRSSGSPRQAPTTAGTTPSDDPFGGPFGGPFDEPRRGRRPAGNEDSLWD
ncbi:MAG TPA: vWA domain-containing protein [Actinomycetaceae bacterium]|nr:vWA domain-containing protein [Actinomycetaceae bacterium]